MHGDVQLCAVAGEATAGSCWHCRCWFALRIRVLQGPRPAVDGVVRWRCGPGCAREKSLPICATRRPEGGRRAGVAKPSRHGFLTRKCPEALLRACGPCGKAFGPAQHCAGEACSRKARIEKSWKPAGHCSPGGIRANPSGIPLALHRPTARPDVWAVHPPRGLRILACSGPPGKPGRPDTSGTVEPQGASPALSSSINAGAALLRLAQPRAGRAAFGGGFRAWDKLRPE